MHDRLASTLALARTMLMGLGPQDETPVRTASLKLILETLLEVGGTPQQRMNEQAVRTVANQLASFDTDAGKMRG